MEGGAELIGLNHLAWWSYKRKFGLHFARLVDSRNPPVILGRKRLDPVAAAKLGREMDRAQASIARVAKRVNADEPWRTPGAKHLDRRSLVWGLNSIPMSDLCRLAFVEQLQTDNGVEARRQSWLGNLAMIKGGGLRKFWTETETHHCLGGNQELAFKFKAQLKTLKLRRTVDRIAIDGKGVTVTLNRGNPVRGSDIVLAVPPTIWSDIGFDPPLPKAYRVQFGKNVKYLLNVQNNCWNPNSPNMSSDGPIDLTWKGTDGRSGSRAGFVAFSGATDAATCSRWKNRAKRYLMELTPLYPGLRKASRNGVFMNWPNKKWARGSYSFPEPGEVTRVGPILRSGFKRRVHFAGEHTCYAFTGYMEGALQSGLRIAEQLARRDGVIP
jgi:monoamine oxidase